MGSSCSFGSARGMVSLRTVRFGSSVNVQNQMEPSQKRTDMKIESFCFGVETNER